jgi:hypothetical protein|tara:strand:+ start:195 stop:617 length:423 start_codon:yes stop_codon:yes gene_type:complete
MPVRAAGILLITSDGQHRLFRNIKNRFEDIGGKTDAVDTSAVDTAVREACEETGGKLFSPHHTRHDCEEMLRGLITNDVEYNSKSKYLLFKLYVHPDILQLNMKRFGLTEKTDWGTLDHYYQWRTDRPWKRHPRLFGMKL